MTEGWGTGMMSFYPQKIRLEKKWRAATHILRDDLIFFSHKMNGHELTITNHTSVVYIQTRWWYPIITTIPHVCELHVQVLYIHKQAEWLTDPKTWKIRCKSSLHIVLSTKQKIGANRG